MPYSASGGNHYGGGAIVYSASFNTDSWEPLVNHNNNFIYFHRRNGNSANATHSDFSGLAQIIIHVTYFTAS